MRSFAGVIAPLTDSAGMTIATPVDFGTDGSAHPRRTPEPGEHTEVVLEELGYDWGSISRLKDEGVLG